MATGTGDDVVVNRDEVVTLCLAALDAVGARRRVGELLTDRRRRRPPGRSRCAAGRPAIRAMS